MDFTNLKNFLDRMATDRTPGCAVCVTVDGKLMYKYAAGVSDIDTKKPMTGDEYFNIYSCTKIATVTAGAKLVEQGIIDLNEPLYEYIPEYREMYIKNKDGNLEKAKNPIRIGHLFSMTAGFNYDRNALSLVKLHHSTEGKYTTADFARALAAEPLSFEPGTNWQYSLCHDVLGGLISIVTGKGFGEYLKESIFEPLGMTKTVFHHTDEIRESMASQYNFVPDNPEELGLSIVEAQQRGFDNIGHFENVGKAITGNFGGFPNCEMGGSGITTTADDYVKLMAALSLGGISAEGVRILSERTVELMKTNRLYTDKKNGVNLAIPDSWRHLAGYGYGLGVRIHIDKAASGSIANLGEFGWGGAAGATAIIDTKERLGVFFVQHTLNPREGWYQPRLRNAVYSCL